MEIHVHVFCFIPNTCLCWVELKIGGTITLIHLTVKIRKSYGGFSHTEAHQRIRSYVPIEVHPSEAKGDTL